MDRTWTRKVNERMPTFLAAVIGYAMLIQWVGRRLAEVSGGLREPG